MTKARIWWSTQDGIYYIATPYNPRFVDAIKALIPASDRAFNPTNKIWSFSERFLSPMVSLVSRLWPGEYVIITRDQAEQATAAPSTISKAKIEDAIVSFFKLLPPEAAQAAYRKAAMLLHPDRGGDLEKMTQLNMLWQRIEKEVFNG